MNKSHSSLKFILPIFVILSLCCCVCSSISAYVYLNRQQIASSITSRDDPAPVSQCGLAKEFDFEALEEAESIDKVELILDNYFREYNLNIVTDNSLPFDVYTKYSALTSSDLENLKKISKVFIEEWSKYTKNWIKFTGVKGVGFVKNIKVDGTFRGAVPDGRNSYVFYGVDDLGPYLPLHDEYVRLVLHHEFYHLIELNTFGDYYYKDPEWQKFNTKNFEYLGKGADAYHDENYTGLDHPQDGFVSEYAMYALEEDKADTYGYLMTKSLYMDVLDWIEEDSYLEAKVEYMKDFVSDNSKYSGDYFSCIND